MFTITHLSLYILMLVCSIWVIVRVPSPSSLSVSVLLMLNISIIFTFTYQQGSICGFYIKIIVIFTALPKENCRLTTMLPNVKEISMRRGKRNDFIPVAIPCPKKEICRGVWDYDERKQTEFPETHGIILRLQAVKTTIRLVYLELIILWVHLHKRTTNFTVCW